MLSVLVKWIANVDDSIYSVPESFIVESEDGEWLLIDLELADNDTILLREYVIVPEGILSCGLSNNHVAASEANTGKDDVSQGTERRDSKKFRGKIVSRVIPRKSVRPYVIIRPIKPRFLAKMWNPALKLQNTKYKAAVCQPIYTLEHIPIVRLSTNSLLLPPKPRSLTRVRNLQSTVNATRLKQAPVLIDDMNAAIVLYETSPLQRLLQDLSDIERKRMSEAVYGLNGRDSLPVHMALNESHLNKLGWLFIEEKRCCLGLNEMLRPEYALQFETSVVYLAHVQPRKALLALEWEQSRPDVKWYSQPVISVFSDFCLRTSQLRQHMPQATLILRVLWTQFLQLLSFGKDLLCCSHAEDQRSHNALQPVTVGKYHVTTHGEEFCDGRNRALREKKTGTQDTKKNLRRAYGAQTQKYFAHRNRRRAMECNRLNRGTGRRGC